MYKNIDKTAVNSTGKRRIRQLRRMASCVLSTVLAITMIHSAVPELVAWADTHAHEWSYALANDGTAITAKCVSGCDDGYDDPGITITLNAPEDLTYSGSAKTATVTGYPTENIPTDLEEAPATILYFTSSDDPLEGAPVAVGNYVAKITWGGQTASKAFTIEPKAVTITANPQTIAYGNSISGLVTDVVMSGNIEGHTLDSISLAASTTNVTTTGTITPSAAVIKSGGDVVTANYSITYNPGTLTITAGGMSVTATGYSGTYDGNPHGITVSAPEGATVRYGTASDACTEAESPTYTAAGTYTVYYQVTKENFETVSGSKTVAIAKADITPTVTLTGWTYGVSGNEPAATGNTGSGAVSFAYYTDENCETPTTTANGAAAEGEEPAFVGTYWVKATIAESTNYNGGTAKASFAITTKALTITAKAQTITHGTGISTLVSQVEDSGLAGGDTIESITLTPDGTNVTTTGKITPSNAVIKRGDVVVTSNYLIDYVDGNLTITAAGMDVSASGYSGTYDGNPHVITVTAPDGATVSYGTAEGTYTLDASPEYTDAGEYTVYYKVEKENCEPVTGSADVVIAKASITPSVSIEGWTYGEAANAPSVTGNLGNGTPEYAYFTDSLCSNPVGAVPTNAGTYWVKATIPATTNYNSETATTEFTIAKVAVTISANNQTKQYGQAISATVDDVEVSGLVTGDILTDIDLSANNLGGDITPDNAVIKKSGTDVTANYDITYGNGTLALTEVNITITAVDQTVPSGSTLSMDTDKVSVTSGALVTGDAITSVTLSPGTTVTEDGTITVTEVVIENASHQDVTIFYNITPATGTYTVTLEAATLTQAPTAVPNLKYTGSAQVLIAAGTASGGTLKYSLDGINYTTVISTITGTNVGTYEVSYMVEGDENHSSTTPDSLEVTIGPMDAPASLDDTYKPTAKTGLGYTGSSQALLNAPETALDGYTIKYSTDGGATYDTTIPTGTAVDSYSISVKYFGDANHAHFTLSSPISVSIAAANLSADATINLDENTFAFGSTPISPTATVRRTSTNAVLVNGTDYDIKYEGVSSTTYARNTVAPTTPGTYNLVAVFKGNYSGEATAEYTITMQSSAPIARNKSITYDGSTYDVNQLFEFVFTADVVGRTFSIVADESTGAGTIAGSTLTITKAGTIKVKVVTAETETVAGSQVTSVLTVAKGTATGTITVTDISYGDVLADPTVDVSPNEAGFTTVEYKTGSGSWSTTKPTAAGNYQARASIGGTDLYEASYVTTTFVIGKATLSVKADNKTKERDAADPAFTYTVTGGLATGDVAADIITGSLTREAGEDVGSYAITQGTLAVTGGNYDLNFVEGTFSITKADHANITVEAANAVTVPTVATEGITFEVKNFISPAPASGTIYTYSSASGIVKTSSPAPSVTGTTVVFAVTASDDAATGSIVVTVNDPNYNAYTVTVPIKSSDTIKHMAEATESSAVVNGVFSANLGDYAHSQSSSSTAVDVKLGIADKAASDVSDNDKASIISAASGLFVGYDSATELTKVYLEIDMTKYTGTSLSTISTVSGGEPVTNTGTPIEIALNVGTGITSKNPVPVRVHNGTTLRFTGLNSRPTGSYSDGTFYVDSSGYIYIYTQYFSLYSLVYANETPKTVTFNSAGGSAVTSISVKGGSAIGTNNKPSDPSRSGYSFAGWYLGDAAYDFTSTVTDNITLTARWNAVSSSSSSSSSSSGSSSSTASTTTESTTTASTTPAKSNTGTKKKSIITVEPIVKEADASKETKETITKPELTQKALDLLEGKSNLTPVLKEERLSGTSDGLMVDLIDKEKDIIHWIIILTGLLGVLLTIAYRKNIAYLIGSFAGATLVMLILSYVGGSDFDYIASAVGIAAMGIVMMGSLRRMLMEDLTKRNNMRVAR